MGSVNKPRNIIWLYNKFKLDIKDGKYLLTLDY